MLVRELEELLEALAPTALTEPWDNTGLLVGDRSCPVEKVLVSLDLTESVLAEALAGGFQAIVSHHPLLFTPLTHITEWSARERMVLGLAKGGVALFACHTNLDAAPGGLAEIFARALGLRELEPVTMTAAGWKKFVGFVPQDALGRVSAAVFAAGAGRIGEYADCAFAANGEGWFRAGEGAHPTVGDLGRSERVPEVRWETVVPQDRVGEVVRAYLRAHPYEEPAFDMYPVDDVIARGGIGRVGALSPPRSLRRLAGDVGGLLGTHRVQHTGDPASMVERVACIPGSGGSLLEQAAQVAGVLVTGDLGYHDAEKASNLGVSLVNAPHELVEDWALRRWAVVLGSRLQPMGVEVVTSKAWRSPWHELNERETEEAVVVDDKSSGEVRVTAAPGGAARRTFVLRVDGGSRGNPGRSAIGVILEDESGEVVERFGRAIGIATNNVAEYSALIAGLQLALRHGVQALDIRSDSELLVKQVKGEYKVRNAGLRDLYDEAIALLREFPATRVRHVPREENVAADKLVNEALD